MKRSNESTKRIKFVIRLRFTLKNPFSFGPLSTLTSYLYDLLRKYLAGWGFFRNFAVENVDRFGCLQPLEKMLKLHIARLALLRFALLWRLAKSPAYRLPHRERLFY